MDNKILTQLLEEWINETKQELKKIKEENRKKNETCLKTSYDIETIKNKQKECSQLIDKYDERIKNLESQDSDFLNKFIENNGCFQNFKTEMENEKKYIKENTVSYNKNIEKQIDKIKDNITWIVRIIVGLIVVALTKTILK